MRPRSSIPDPAMWRYSLRWGLRHKPCPGAFEIAAADVPAGDSCPGSVSALWIPGSGYIVSIDFLQTTASVRRWSKEAKARTRLRNLAARLQRQAPMFADEFLSRETARRPAYFAGEDTMRNDGGRDVG